ncbi:MAG: hypothetical protein AAFX53_16125 [Bacteroidota bacterium]
MKPIPKIRAGALQFVLFVGALITILLMAFLLLAHTHGHFEKRTDVLISTIKTANAALVSSLGEDTPFMGFPAVEDSDAPPISVRVERDFWGIFEKRTVFATHGKTQYRKTALVGAREGMQFPALYVKDRQRPVILAGNARITGTAFLPEQGLRMGNIRGNAYSGTQLLYGESKKSGLGLPPIHPEVVKQIQTLTSEGYQPFGEVLSQVPREALGNSFEAPPMIIRDRVVRLQKIALSGNIIVSASDKIIVEAQTQLQDVILLAPEIVIKDRVKGYFQAFARTSISVGKQCELAYPTALVVKKKSLPKTEGKKQAMAYGNGSPAIFLDSQTQLRGVLMVLEDAEERQYYPQIHIAENSLVTGEVYCTKSLELKGQVNGSVTTDSFIALENGNVYQNHLFNGIINSHNLSPSYTGLLMTGRDRNKKIMKWLY